MRYIDDYARGKRDPGVGPLRRRAPAPDHRGDLRLLHLPGAADGDLEADRAASRGAEADDLRKAIGKKKRDMMATMESKFIEGCAASGTAPARRQGPLVADDRGGRLLVQQVHAACYALIAYRTAYLKANYPAEYMAAVISSVMSTKDKVPFFVNTLRGDGDRGAAARRQHLRPRLRRLRQQDPLRPRRGQERRPRGRRGDHRAPATRSGDSTRSGTSASASTPAPSTSARSSA